MKCISCGAPEAECLEMCMVGRNPSENWHPVTVEVEGERTFVEKHSEDAKARARRPDAFVDIPEDRQYFADEVLQDAISLFAETARMCGNCFDARLIEIKLEEAAHDH